MALTYFAGRKLTGTNSDRTGGTWTNLPAGWIFTETDTRNSYYWDGSVWQVMSGPTATITYTNKSISGSTNTLTNIPDSAFASDPWTTTANNTYVIGALMPANTTSTFGLLAGQTTTGSASTVVGTNGQSRRCTAAGSAGDNAGFRNVLAQSRRDYDPEMYYRFQLSHTNTDMTAYFGWCSNTGAPTGDDYLNAKSGWMLYVTSGNSNFRIGKNDGSGATVFVDTLIPVDTNVHYLILKGDDANARWGWALDSTTLQYETTEIPASTTAMAPIIEVEAVTGTAVTLDTFKWILKHKK